MDSMGYNLDPPPPSSNSQQAAKKKFSQSLWNFAIAVVLSFLALSMIMASQPPLTYPLLRPYFCGWYLSGGVGWLASSHEMTAIGFRCRRWNRSELYEWNFNLLDVDGGPFHKLCYNGILSLTNEIHLSQLKSVHQLTPGPKKTLNCCFKIQSFAIDFWWGPKQRIQFHFEWFPLWF